MKNNHFFFNLACLLIVSLVSNFSGADSIVPEPVQQNMSVFMQSLIAVQSENPDFFNMTALKYVLVPTKTANSHQAMFWSPITRKLFSYLVIEEKVSGQDQPIYVAFRDFDYYEPATEDILFQTSQDDSLTIRRLKETRAHQARQINEAIRLVQKFGHPVSWLLRSFPSAPAQTQPTSCLELVRQ